MTGLQRKAYKAQSVALVMLSLSLISLIMNWDNTATYLLFGAFVCLVKAMMYRERWEIDVHYEGLGDGHRARLQDGAEER